jgi:hypothetical protein
MIAAKLATSCKSVRHCIDMKVQHARPQLPGKKRTHVDELVWQSVQREVAPSCESRQHIRGAQPYLSFFALLAGKDVLREAVEQ